MGKITIESATKGIDEGFNLYLFIFISLLAGIGFILGSFSLSLWFVQHTGSLPNFLIIIFKCFDIMMWVGVVFIGFKLYLFFLKKVVKPFVEKKQNREEKWIKDQIVKELKKIKRGKK